MIELYHIWKQYQKPHWAISDISLEINTGDFCFITAQRFRQNHSAENYIQGNPAHRRSDSN